MSGFAGKPFAGYPDDCMPCTITAVSDWSNEETNDPLVADARNFYKVEKWTRDGMKVDNLLYGGNNLDKAAGRASG